MADTITDGAILQVVVPYKQTISVSQESKTLSEQIKFVDEYKIGIDTTAEEIFNAAFGKDGDQYSISDDYKSDTVTLTRDVYTNDVTGEKTYGNWTVSSGFNVVDNPTIDNYKIDSSKIYEQFMGAASALASTSAENIGSVSADTILKEADTITDGAVLQLVVPYTVVPTTPTKPDVPTTPTTPDIPTTPTTPDVPTTPTKPDVPTTPTTPVVPTTPTTPNVPTTPDVPTTPTTPDEPTTPVVPSLLLQRCLRSWLRLTSLLPGSLVMVVRQVSMSLLARAMKLLCHKLVKRSLITILQQ